MPQHLKHRWEPSLRHPKWHDAYQTLVRVYVQLLEDPAQQDGGRVREHLAQSAPVVLERVCAQPYLLSSSFSKLIKRMVVCGPNINAYRRAETTSKVWLIRDCHCCRDEHIAEGQRVRPHVESGCSI